APSAPTGQPVLEPLLLAAQNSVENRFLQEIKLRTIAKETRFVNSAILKKQRQFRASFPAGEQAVVRIEGVELTGFQTALQAVFEEVRAAFIKKHAAFLIDQRLEELQLCFGELDLGSNRSHCVFVRRFPKSGPLAASRK